MTGPEHYAAAEQLQEHARAMAEPTTRPTRAETAARVQRRMADLADAQVHTLLALTAAVAIGGNLSGADMMPGPTSLPSGTDRSARKSSPAGQSWCCEEPSSAVIRSICP